MKNTATLKIPLDLKQSQSSHNWKCSNIISVKTGRSFGKSPSGTGFQILFKCSCHFFCIQGDGCLYAPRSELRCVRHISGIVFCKSCGQILRWCRMCERDLPSSDAGRRPYGIILQGTETRSARPLTAQSNGLRRIGSCDIFKVLPLICPNFR